MNEPTAGHTGRRVYRLHPLVWFGPLLVVVFFAVFASAVGYPLRQRLIFLAIATGPATLLLIMALRTRTVLDTDGVRLCRPFSSRFVAWDAIEAVAVRPIGWTRTPMIALRVAGEDIAVPASVPGLFRHR